MISQGSPIPTPTPGCKDYEDLCGKMARYGGCSSQEEFMKMFCRKTCKYCLEGTVLLLSL